MNELKRARILLFDLANRAHILVVKSIDRARRKSIGSVKRFTDIVKLQSNDYRQEINRMVNQLTGYEECEQLRKQVLSNDNTYQRLKEGLSSTRIGFEAAIQKRSKCQKDLNALLQRKQSWNDEDLLKFTELYRNEIKFEQIEADARITNQRMEMQVDEAHRKLMDSLRERYQEEQLWSDKIRRLSTFGTFSLMAFNVLLFLIIQLVIEPKKKKTILRSFEQVLDEKIALLRESERDSKQIKDDGIKAKHIADVDTDPEGKDKKPWLLITFSALLTANLLRLLFF